MYIRNGIGRKFILATIFLILSACTSTNTNYHTEAISELAPTIEPLVTAEWLNEHLNDPDLVVLDTTVLVVPDEKGGITSLSGKDNYAKGHIQGAGFADLMGDLSNTESELTFVMPTPEQFADAMSKLGVGNDSKVVLYSSNYPSWPARVWWMLRWIGFDNAAVLDGGLGAWQMAGMPLSTEPADRPARQLSINLRPELVADRDEVFASIDKPNVTLVDAMPDAHYIGEMVMYARPGHIPSAINAPDFNQLNETGAYRPLDELEMLHDSNRTHRAITYCGGGISASSVAFTMHRLGFTDVAVYMGSLQEWAPDPANPLSVVAPD
jgi:thiosulfate/3-mercaptopyruvate sulfurtransferase